MSKSGVKLERGEKAQAIRDAMKGHPHLKNRELVDILAAKGIKCTTQDIANQKARNKRMDDGGGKKDFTLDDLLKVKTVVAEAGGIKAVQSKLMEIEELAKQAGGLEKLRKGLDVLPKFSS